MDINPTTATVNYIHSNLLSARPGGHYRVLSLPFALRRGGPQSYAPASVQTKLASKLHSPNVNYGLDPTRALINEPTETSALSSPYMCRRLIYNLLIEADNSHQDVVKITTVSQVENAIAEERTKLEALECGFRRRK